MDTIGRLTNVSRDWQTGKLQIAFEVDESAVSQIDEIKDVDRLTIKVSKFRKKRSTDANGMLWACLGQLSNVLHADKWEIYLRMLKRYGKFTYIVVKENAVDAVKAQWRETEVIGEVTVNGQKAIQMLCYFGSSTYNTAEFSRLLDGVISEMKEIGLEPPMSEEVKAAMERWEREWEKRNQ